MFRKMCRAKINRATVTKKDLNYKGSIGIDKKILEASGILANEMVSVLNCSNTHRFQTYVIEEEENSGIIALYGPAANLGEIGDKVIILSSAFVEENEAKSIELRVIDVDDNNGVI